MNREFIFGDNFRALKTFWCEELQSEYVEGLIYTIESENEKLLNLVQIWSDTGAVEYHIRGSRIFGTDI